MSTQWDSPLLSHYDSDVKLGENDGCKSASQFEGFEAEYHALRNSLAISDNCHYGKFVIKGSDAQQVANQLVMADVARLAIGRATWTFMLREDGSVICDVYVICRGDEYWLLSEGLDPTQVLDQIHAAAESTSATVEDLTQSMAIIGVDGPYAWELLKDLVGVRILGLRYLEFLEDQPVGESTVHIIRSGKTGEFGYQLMMDASAAGEAWKALHAAGKEFDATAAGYESLEHCRLENRFINMHREGMAVGSPLELNCRVMVDQEKEEYIGHESLQQAMGADLAQRIVGLKIEGSADDVPALDASVTAEGQQWGKIVNASYSPQLGMPIALALLNNECAYVGLDFEIESEMKTLSARSVSAPFVFNKSLTVRPQEDSYKA